MTKILLSSYENLNGEKVKFPPHVACFIWPAPLSKHCEEMFIFIQALASGMEMLVTSNGPLKGL
jgi:hypothetical protein